MGDLSRVLLGLLIFLVPAAAQTESKAGPGSLRAFSEAIQDLTARVAPSVVKILVSGYGPVAENNRMDTALIGRQRSIGSGVIVDPAGYIVTNAHVVSGAQRVRVAVNPATPEGTPTRLGASPRTRVLEARIIGVDKVTDLAVLKVDATDLPALAIAAYSRLRQGQLVLAFGAPEGLENSVTMGVVSSVLRQLDPDAAMVYIQTDAAINPGNSGGPLVDVEGNLIGINSAILSESGGNEGIGFAIPSVIVRSVYRQIRRNGHVHRGEIGAKLQTITAPMAAGLQLPRNHGVIVSDVNPDGPAATAGLRANDILVAINGNAIEGLPAIAAALYLRSAGEALHVEVLRNNERIALTIPIVEKDQDLDNIVGAINPEKSLIGRLGILGIEIDSKIADMIPGLRMKSGILIAAKSAGPSIETGLNTADIIHAVNKTPIASLDGLRTAIEQLKSGDPVVLLVERDGVLMYLSFDWE